jgi:hypothetical protein
MQFSDHSATATTTFYKVPILRPFLYPLTTEANKTRQQNLQITKQG